MRKLMQARLVFVVFVLLSGCCGQSVHRTPDGRYIPNKWSGWLPALGQKKATQPLRYDVLYVGRDEFNEWAWYRFWPSGQVHECTRQKDDKNQGPPNLEDGERFFYHGAGKYCVIGNKIYMEYVWLRGDVSLFCGSEWYRELGVVNDDGSIIMNHPDPEHPSINDHPELWPVYHPTYVGEMKRMPDW